MPDDLAAIVAVRDHPGKLAFPGRACDPLPWQHPSLADAPAQDQPSALSRAHLPFATVDQNQVGSNPLPGARLS
jgi:hypothetical protein